MGERETQPPACAVEQRHKSRPPIPCCVEVPTPFSGLAAFSTDIATPGGPSGSQSCCAPRPTAAEDTAGAPTEPS